MIVVGFIKRIISLVCYNLKVVNIYSYTYNQNQNFMSAIKRKEMTSKYPFGSFIMSV